MPASDKRKAARVARALGGGNTAPDADSTLDRDSLDEMPANEKSEGQRNMEAMLSQCLGAMKKEYPLHYNSCPYIANLSQEDTEFDNLTAEDIQNPRFDHIISFMKQRGFPKVPTGTAANNLIKQYEAMKGKQKAAGQPSQDNTAAGHSTSYTAALCQFLAVSKGEKGSDVNQLINAIKQLEEASARAFSRPKLTEQMPKQKATGQSSQDNTVAGPPTSDTMMEKDNRNAAGKPSTDKPNCFAPIFKRRMREYIRKEERKKRREEAARKDSQVSTTEHLPGNDPSGEPTQNTHGITLPGLAEPKDTAQDSAGQDLKGSAIAAFSKDAPVPMLIHDLNQPNPDYELLIENGFM
ncbi:hypothetical protein PMIN02_002157 [Paraphaeosphaeria minitans]|uniref:Uncharacterized protein n=1 Tax=Paraphaeosphaeria minitans TaxID=565426 RepID=A0A9P6KQ11_9PLEO|nr:hypothetical protein PMIN01_06683 [Paraphaeosphaeria minitans]